MTERTCTQDGCDRKVRARGLCSTHYNRMRYTPEQRHPKIKMMCHLCGTVTRKPPASSHGYDYRFCSLLCRDLYRWEFRTEAPRTPQASRPKRSCLIPPDHPARWYGDASALEWRPCLWCGRTYPCRAGHGTRAYCNATCKRRAKHVRRKATESLAGNGYWTWSDFMRMAARFDYRCAYCNTKPDRLDADHVVALGKGGQNVLTNLLPACLMCNSDKRDLTLTEWDADRQRRGLPARATSWGADDARYRHLTWV